MASTELIKEIVLHGTVAEKLELYNFNISDTDDKIAKKFRIWGRALFPRYFSHRESPDHKIMVLNYVKSYKGAVNGIEIAFRGFGKTSILKLFIAFVLLNDKDRFRRYLKILARDLKNSKQMVTDVYNLMVEVVDLYGNQFEKEGDMKREETMGSFTTKGGQKLTAGTVGVQQRGHLQDAFRPDWIIFEDVEDRESVSSIAITESVIGRCDEAITGLSFNGSYQVNANYISDAGTVQWFLNKKGINAHITPIVRGDIPTWDRYTPEHIQKLKDDAEDWAGDFLCVKPDTEILTDNGYKKISDIKIGDMVWTHKNRFKPVSKLFTSNSEELLDITVNGQTITITKNHPVLAVRNNIEDWVKAGDLAQGDLVLLWIEQTQTHKIEKIEKSKYYGVVLNFEVEEDNSYVANNLLVHNCDPSRVGDKFFDIDRVEGDIKKATDPVKTSASVRYWDIFKANHRYGIGEDLSDGIGKDSCAFALFDFTTGELVVTSDDNNTAPDLFTYEVVRIGQEFGNCIIAPETNNTCGGIAVRVLKEKNYPNIYQKQIEDKIGNVVTNTIGWHTNSKTKPDMFYEFRKDYNDGLVKIKDIRVLKEMKAFTKADLKDARTSAVTRHFDLLTSVCIAWQMRNHATYAHSTKDFYANLKNGSNGKGARS
jgi:intein/homing endonuclease